MLARLRVAHAAGIPGQVVPHVAAIDDDREIHVGRVVLGQRRQLDRRAQTAEIGGGMALEEGQRAFLRGQT